MKCCLYSGNTVDLLSKEVQKLKHYKSKHRKYRSSLQTCMKLGIYSYATLAENLPITSLWCGYAKSSTSAAPQRTGIHPLKGQIRNKSIQNHTELVFLGKMSKSAKICIRKTLVIVEKRAFQLGMATLCRAVTVEKS